MVDTLSHGLWGIVLIKGLFKKGSLWLALFFGVIPDLIPFTIPFAQMILARDRFGPPTGEIPTYISTLYNFTHSLVIAAIVFLLIYIIFKKFYPVMLAWPLHIIIDIPTHSREFFPTPFLYPLSDITVKGINWSNPYIFFPNWIILFTLLIIVFRKELKRGVKRILRKI